MPIKRNLANFFTLLNLLAGTAAIVFIFRGQYLTAFWLVLTGIGFDFIDGLVARLTRTSSALGLELDSLADLVTSGLAPAFLLFRIWQEVMPASSVPWFALLIAPASAWRLARFNLDPRQKEHFIGLPTPANALFLFSVGLSIAYHPDFFLTPYFRLPVVAVSVVLFSALMLNAPVPLLALKFKDGAWQNNAIKYILVALSAVLLFWLGIPGIVFVLLLYILLSIVYFQKHPA